MRRDFAAAFAFPMLVWIPLMGAGVVGGIALMAMAGDPTALPVAVVISVLGLVSATLAAVAVVRQRAGGFGRLTIHAAALTADRLPRPRRILAAALVLATV